MSQWTHVGGVIRYDWLRLPGNDRPDFENILGKKYLWDDLMDLPFDEDPKTKLPMGSEGSLNWLVYENPDNSLAAYTITVFGDLRDFGQEDVEEQIIPWWNKIIEDHRDWIRSAVLEADVEYGEKTVLVLDKDKVNVV